MADTQKMLNFKMGELANLQALTTKTPGTIYVTTDERAMYLDVDVNTRIRLGDAIITVNKITELANVQPWQAGAMYYATEDDVLVLYTGSKFQLVNEKLINQVTTLNSTLNQTNIDLSNLTNKVGTVATKDDIDTVGEWLSHLDSRTTTLEGEMDTAQSDIDKAEAAIVKIQEDIASITGGGTDSIKTLKEAISALDSTTKEHTTAISGLQTLTGNQGNAITQLQTDVQTAQSTANKGVTDAATAQAAADKAQGEVDALETKVGGVESVVNEHTGKITVINSTLESLQSQIDGNDKDIEDLKDADDAITEAYEAADAKLREDFEAADIAINSSISGLSAQLQEEITNRTNADASIRTDFAAADATLKTNYEAADTKIREDFAAADAQIKKDFAAADSALSSTISGVSAQLGTETSERKQAISDLDKAYKQADQNIIDAYTLADQGLQSQITDNAEDIADLKEAIGTGNTGTSLTGRVSALETLTQGHTTEISGHEGRLDTLEETTIPGIKTDIQTIQNTMATDTELSEAKTELEGKITTAQNAANQAQKEVDALEEVVNEFKTTVSSTYATKDELEEEASARSQADTALGNRIAAFEANGAHDVAALETRVGTVEGKATTNATNISNNAQAISTNTTDIATNKTNIAANLAAINAIKDGKKLDSFADVEAEIASAIAASDAMVFKGVVNLTSGLPDDAQAGWTYKVAQAGSYKGNNCKVGDLLIALVDNPSADADWAYVPSGGEDADNLVMSSTGTTISLNNDVNTAKGSVTFESKNDSLVVEGNGANKIAIGMVWGSF